MPIFLFFFFFVIALMVLKANNTSKIEVTWRRVATQLDGQYIAGELTEAHKIVGMRLGHSFRITTFRRRVNRSMRNGTRYKIVSKPLPFEFQLVRTNAIEGESAENVVELDDPYFSTRFRLTSPDPEAARAYFDNHRRRDIDHYLGGMPDMRLTHKDLQYEKMSVDSKESRMITTVESLVAISASMRHQLVGHEEEELELDLPPAQEPVPLGLEPEARVVEMEAPPKAQLEPQVPFEEPLIATEADLSPAGIEPRTPEAYEPIPPNELEAFFQNSPPTPEPEPAAFHAQVPEPSPVEPAPPRAVPVRQLRPEVLFETLFVDGRMGMEIEGTFAQQFAGAGLSGEGQLVRIDNLPGARLGAGFVPQQAHVEVFAEGSVPHGRPLLVLLEVPADWTPSTAGLERPRVRFAGRLASCEPYMRQVVLEDSTIERL